jgi:hypothetical protein
MRPLWIHANVENLQNHITRYLYSSRHCPVDRYKITQEWENIKSDMERVLVEMDLEASARKMFDKGRDALSDQTGKPK